MRVIFFSEYWIFHVDAKNAKKKKKKKRSQKVNGVLDNLL